MNYTVNFSIINIDSNGNIKTSTENFKFPFSNAKEALSARKQAIVKATQLSELISNDDSFDSPMAAMLKGFTNTIGGSIELWLNAGENDVQIFGIEDEMVIESLCYEASILKSIGVKDGFAMHLDDDGVTEVEVVDEDIEFIFGIEYIK